MKDTPSFITMMLETKTTETDWYIGVAAIGQAIGRSVTDRRVLPARFPYTMVATPFGGRASVLAVARKSDVAEWQKQQQTPAAPLLNGSATPVPASPFMTQGDRETLRHLALGMSNLAQKVEILHGVMDDLAAKVVENTKAARELRDVLKTP